jgi:hypothetical protein
MPFLIPILSAIVPALLPSLVKKVLPSVILKAETEMPEAAGEDKKKWVLDCFHDVIAVLEAKGVLSEKWRAAIEIVLPKLSDWIEDAIEKLKKADKM